MFWAQLCPSSGAQEYYMVVAACGFTGHITLSSTPDQQRENHSMKYHRQQPPYNTLAPDDGHSGAQNMLSKQ